MYYWPSWNPFRLIGQRRMNGKLLSFKQYFGLEIFLEPLPGVTLMTRKFFQKQYRMSQKCCESYKYQETSFFSFPVICFFDRFGRNITIFCSHLVYFLGNFGTSLWVFFPKFLEDKGMEETPAIALLGFLRFHAVNIGIFFQNR